MSSAAEEQKIRAFLKMFYFAHLYILVIGVMLSQVCASWFIIGSLERPAHRLLASISIFVVIYGLAVGLPYGLLWRAYKRALTSFTATTDEVSLSGSKAPHRQWILLAVAGCALLVLAAILVLAVRPTVP